MNKEDIYNAVSDIRPEYLDEADNYKAKTQTEGGATVINSENDNKNNKALTREYDIEAETSSGKRYMKYIASAAAVLFIAGIAGAAAGIQMNHNNENNTLAEVSQTQAVSEITENIITEVTAKSPDTAVSETESNTVTRQSATEPVTIVSETPVSSVVTDKSDETAESKTEDPEHKADNRPAENQQPIQKGTEVIPVTEVTMATEAVKQTEPVTDKYANEKEKPKETETANDIPDTDDDLDSCIKKYVFETVEIDIDKDGTAEKCTLSYGPTSGLYTVIISAYTDGILEYRNTFNLNPKEKITVTETGGIVYLKRTGINYATGEADEILNRIHIEDNGIVIDDLTEYEGYYGGPEFNINLAD